MQALSRLLCPRLTQRLIMLMLPLLMLVSLFSPLEQQEVRAEGSRNLIGSGGYRAFLEYQQNGQTAGIPRRNVIKAYANAGETINLGSSATGFDPDGTAGPLPPADIRYRRPDGTAGTCGPGVGLIANRAQEVAGPLPNTNGYTPCALSVGAGQNGIWEIEFLSPNPGSGGNPTPITVGANWTQPNNVYWITAWDVTVRNSSGTDIPGRVYANYLALNMGSNASSGNPIGLSSEVYIQTRDGYRYSIDLNGIDPFGFIFFANNKGFTDSNGNPLYKSIQFPGANPGNIPPGISVHNPNNPDTATDVTHKIFFEPPAADLPATANSASGSTWLLVPPAPPPTPNNFTFIGAEGTPGQAGSLALGGTFSFNSTASGNFSIVLDLNRDGTYGNANDRALAGIAATGANSVVWDGRDGNGVAVPNGSEAYNVRITLQGGEVHFPFLDAENNISGIVIERLLPSSTLPERFTVYYDDRYKYTGTNTYDYSPCASGETPAPPASANVATPVCYGVPPTPRNALNGVSSATGAHAFSTNFGDRRGIDTWVYVPSAPVQLSGGIVVAEADLAITKTHSPATFITGQPVEYTVTVRNNGPDAVSGATVQDNVPASITNVTWTCSASAGGSCAAPSGAGNAINTSVNLANGATATFTIQGILSVSASGSVVNTARVLRPNDVNDPTDPSRTGAGNNTAVDTAPVADPAPGTVSGVVFNDINGNGVQDSGEDGLAGVTVRLIGGNGGPRTVTTDATGAYLFTGVPAGAYSVQETEPTGYVSTTSNSVAVSVAAGGAAIANFGNQQTGTVSGTVFNDLNGNGLQDTGETGIAGVTVQLLGGATGPRTTTTDANGNYLFTNVTAGAYTVQETDPAGYVSTTSNSVAVSVAPGGAATANFGDQQTGIVSGVVFEDINGNRIQDSGEPGIANVTVELINQDGIIVTTTTNASGVYTFAPVSPGTYTVRENDPSGYTSTTSNTVTVSVAPGGSATANFGDQRTGTVSGRVFNDLNGNGIQDPNEQGIGGVTVELINTSTGTTVSTTTAADGTYLFSGVVPGNYSVRETNPVNYTSTTPDTVSVIVPNGGAATANFGDKPVGGVSGVVFNDLNGNGQPDPSEQGIGGVTVRLVDADGTVVASTTTAGDGSYRFENVTVGAYTVQETDPAGYVSTTSNIVPVSVAAGGAATANFGDKPVGVVSGVVFNDLNGNGQPDPTEQGIGGVTVRLVDSTGTVVASTTTAGDGSYRFEGVTAGSYTVQETDPAGYTSTTSNTVPVSVAAGGAATANFGDKPVGVVSGVVFNDLNGNGQPDPSEQGIGGVTVRLVDADGTVVASTTTTGDGSYRFENVTAGAYTVQETDPAGYTSTTSNTVPVSVAAGGAATANFGDQQVGQISGEVFDDLDNDGVRDLNETGLGGVRIELLDSTGTVIATTTTAVNGSYIFIGVPAGNYTVREIDPSGYRSTTPNDVAVLVPPGGSGTASFGDQQLGQVSGIVFADLNGNGVQDRDEAGIGGVTVQLRDANGQVVGTTTTAGDGSYIFTGLPAGRYTVIETDPSGYISTTDNTVAVSVPPGGEARPNFGDQPVATVSGRVFNDHNGNGAQDPGEEGIGGVTVQLLNAAGTVVATTTTAGDGSYLFTGVAAGSYTVRETDPNGYTSTTPNTVPVTVPAGGSGTANFGDRQVGTVSGRVYHDLNNNGQQDPGESGLGGVPVQLIDAGPDGRFGTADDVIIGTTTTANDGSYIFINVPPGNYGVQSPSPGGYTNTTPVLVPVTVGTGTGTANFGQQTSPTAITLTQFTATRQGRHIRVAWATSLEIDTWGFALYRSTGGTRASAVRVTPELILAQGRGQNGATYAWTDTQVQPGVHYTYWLQELETGGAIHEYGPIKVNSSLSMTENLIFLPIVVR